MSEVWDSLASVRRNRLSVSHKEWITHARAVQHVAVLIPGQFFGTSPTWLEQKREKQTRQCEGIQDLLFSRHCE